MLSSACPCNVNTSFRGNGCKTIKSKSIAIIQWKNSLKSCYTPVYFKSIEHEHEEQLLRHSSWSGNYNTRLCSAFLIADKKIISHYWNQIAENDQLSNRRSIVTDTPIRELSIRLSLLSRMKTILSITSSGLQHSERCLRQAQKVFEWLLITSSKIWRLSQ